MKLKRFRQVVEARRNPEQNPKQSAWEILAKYEGRDDVFFSYTEIDKIGINPKTAYSTPIGVYCYPADGDVMARIIERKKASAVPFAGESKFINILQSSNVISLDQIQQKHVDDMIDVCFEHFIASLDNGLVDIEDAKMFVRAMNRFIFNEMEEEERSYLIDDLEDFYFYASIFSFYDSWLSRPPASKKAVYEETGGKHIMEFMEAASEFDGRKNLFAEADPSDGLIDAFDEVRSPSSDSEMADFLRRIVNTKSFKFILLSFTSKVDDWKTYYKNPKREVKKFWTITWKYLNQVLLPIFPLQMKNSIPVMWNKILRKVLSPYVGVSDPGYGIIHENEPNQCFFFTKNGFKVVARILNKDYKEQPKELMTINVPLGDNLIDVTENNSGYVNIRINDFPDFDKIFKFLDVKQTEFTTTALNLVAMPDSYLGVKPYVYVAKEKMVAGRNNYVVSIYRYTLKKPLEKMIEDGKLTSWKFTIPKDQPL